MTLARPPRLAIEALDRDGWRLCLRRVYVDGSVSLSAHHFKSFEQRTFAVTVDGRVA